jgi:hypothetical protein
MFRTREEAFAALQKVLREEERIGHARPVASEGAAKGQASRNAQD